LRQINLLEPRNFLKIFSSNLAERYVIGPNWQLEVPEPHCGTALVQIPLNDALCGSSSATLLL
jgi:hypothetical protein